MLYSQLQILSQLATKAYYVNSSPWSQNRFLSFLRKWNKNMQLYYMYQLFSLTILSLFGNVMNLCHSYFIYCIQNNLPTLISKLSNRSPQQSPLFTKYTSVTSSSCPRSTLHQGWFCLPSVIVHDPTGFADWKCVLLFPSTALLLLPSLYWPLYWYVCLPYARFSSKEMK